MTTKKQAYGPHPEEVNGSWPLRSTIRGTRYGSACGHHLGAQTAFEVLASGGNAVDAGVAAGMVEAVAQPDQVNFAGVAPIMIFDSKQAEIVTISGLGTWPAAVSSEFFIREHNGSIPPGLLSTVVPGAPAAWLAALERYGTMSFGDVAANAVSFAGNGFAIHAFTAAEIRKRQDHYRKWPENERIYLPGGAPPIPGDIFIQSDLADTLRYMIDCETAASSKGRSSALQAAHDAFYRGDIATEIVRYHRENGGLMAFEDMAGFEARIEPPATATYKDLDIFTCGFWSQGPTLLQALNILKGVDLKSLGHNSTAYLHTLAEALKLAFADRHAYYGDPSFIDVPASVLLSDAYATSRRDQIDPDKAWPAMPPAGVIGSDPDLRHRLGAPKPSDKDLEPVPDTSIVCTLDKNGNVFAASPSDPSYNTEVIPGLGLCPSSRGCQSWADPSHPSSVAPGKRPRLTPMPAIALHDGRPALVWGTPGGDVQPQAMLQAFLNMIEFDMDPQNAVEAPRFVSRSMPDSFEPHHYFPGQLNLEAKIPKETGEALSAMGHDVQWWPKTTSRAGGVCAIRIDTAAGRFDAAADFRRCGYAIGW